MYGFLYKCKGGGEALLTEGSPSLALLLALGGASARAGQVGGV